jgi:hypothetical protein
MNAYLHKGLTRFQEVLFTLRFSSLLEPVDDRLVRHAILVVQHLGAY